MNAKLAELALTLETVVGAASAANQSITGWGKRIGVAAEDLAGAGTAANENLLGYLKRAAVALEVVESTSPAGYNEDYDGYIARIVNALEANAGVSVGSWIQRAIVAAGLYTSNVQLRIDGTSRLRIDVSKMLRI